MLVYHQKDVKKNEQNLEKKISNACDWFVDNKLMIHAGDDKEKACCLAQNITSAKSIELVLDIVQYTLSNITQWRNLAAHWINFYQEKH